MKSRMPASTAAFTSGPLAMMAKRRVNKWPITYSTTPCNASTARATIGVIVNISPLERCWRLYPRQHRLSESGCAEPVVVGRLRQFGSRSRAPYLRGGRCKRAIYIQVAAPPPQCELCRRDSPIPSYWRFTPHCGRFVPNPTPRPPFPGHNQRHYHIRA